MFVLLQSTTKQRDLIVALTIIAVIVVIICVCSVALRFVFGEHVAGRVPHDRVLENEQYVSQIENGEAKIASNYIFDAQGHKSEKGALDAAERYASGVF